jgi:nucleoside-diphosphate-sugar epimerase
MADGRNSAVRVFVFGYGYSALALARATRGKIVQISGCVRSPDKAGRLRADGHNVFALDAPTGKAELLGAIARSDAVVQSAAPGEAGDPLLAIAEREIATAPNLTRLLYWSTLGVYGDHRCAWIDEDAPLLARSPRTLRRVNAEKAWAELGQRTGKVVMIHRLAGIYGPGRSALDDLREGSARRIHKEGQVFNRIHVDDIAGAALAALAHPKSPSVVSVCDDLPAPSADVVTFAASLLGIEPPPIEPFETAQLSEMAQSFWQDCRRCRNDRLRKDLGYDLKFPDYKSGLRDCADHMSQKS